MNSPVCSTIHYGGRNKKQQFSVLFSKIPSFGENFFVPNFVTLTFYLKQALKKCLASTKRSHRLKQTCSCKFVQECVTFKWTLYNKRSKLFPLMYRFFRVFSFLHDHHRIIVIFMKFQPKDLCKLGRPCD